MRKYLMRCGSLALALSVVVQGATPVLSQKAVEPQVISNSSLAKTSFDVMADLFISCLLNKRGYSAKLLAWTRLSPHDPRSGSTLLPLLDQSCVPVDYTGNGYSLKADHLLYRSVLFSELYSFYRKKGQRPDKWISKDYSTEFVSEPSDDLTTMLWMRQFGDCVAGGATDPVDKLLNTRIGSTEERESWSLVTPTLAQCVEPQKQMKFSKLILRGMLAEAMYKQVSMSPQMAAN